MKILIVSDHESRRYWDFYQPGMLDGYDLILSAGDLSPQYLEFLVTMGHSPLYYVHGNHDDCYEQTPPGGCDCIDGKVVEFKGVRILGLGGSMRYKNGKNMYTPKEMRRRILKALPSILKHRGFDILLTHAPAAGLNDSEDLPHRGFEDFLKLMDRFEPAYFIHGHNHRDYSSGYKREDRYGRTFVINAWESYELEVPEGPAALQKKNRKG